MSKEELKKHAHIYGIKIEKAIEINNFIEVLKFGTDDNEEIKELAMIHVIESKGKGVK